jgi:hypothetical protein
MKFSLLACFCFYGARTFFACMFLFLGARCFQALAWMHTRPNHFNLYCNLPTCSEWCAFLYLHKLLSLLVCSLHLNISLYLAQIEKKIIYL